VANIVDDWPLIKQNPGASAREKKERCSITRYTSQPSKSMLFSYRRDAVPYQRDSNIWKVLHRTIARGKTLAINHGLKQKMALFGVPTLALFGVPTYRGSPRDQALPERV
jgi:hypothetical protein